jgi:HNH endonuclease
MVSDQLAELYHKLTTSAFAFVPRGEHRLDDVYRAVQDRFPDLCDDTALCKQFCSNSTNKGPEWQHRVRAVLNLLKSKGPITKSRYNYWTFTSSPYGEHVQQLEQSRKALEKEGYFDPGNIEDERKKTLREIAQRQGQADFRHKLLVAYGGRCCVTGCDAEAALEASHIVPYRGSQSNHVTNGLLLRSDIHTLFDLDLIGIVPEPLEVTIAEPIQRTCYGELKGRKLLVPQKVRLRPSFESLKQRWLRFAPPMDDRAE